MNMRPLFSKSGLQLVESFSITDPLYAFDFDGTLAPIVRSPDDALMAKSNDLLLKKLSNSASVAIISGRSIDNLKARISLKGVSYIGNHGLEGLSSKPETLTLASGICIDWEKKFINLIGGSLERRGIFIENKIYSLAIHYRHSRKKKEEKSNIMNAVSSLHPNPRIILGKCVVNIIPAGAPHKGVALLELMKNLGKKTAIYIGDDDTDEDVFSLPDTGLLTIRIGKKKASFAQFYLDRQSDIQKFLKLLLKERLMP